MSVEVKHKRKDVLVIEGGIVKVPGDVEFNFDFGFPKGHSHACMAETMILALEEKYENWSPGRDLSVAQVSRCNWQENTALNLQASGVLKTWTREEIEMVNRNALVNDSYR